MARIDIESRIREKIDAKIARLKEKLVNLPEDQHLYDELAEIKEQLAALNQSGKDIGSDSVARDVLMAKRERLQAKQERIELKIELMQEKRDRIQEAIEGLQETYSETVRETLAAQRSAATRNQTTSSSSQQRTQEEQRKILEMVQDGKITADEAARLLDALRTKQSQAQERSRKPRWVRIRVTDTLENRVRVNLTLPIGLVRAGLRAGGSIAGVEGLDTAGLEEMLNRGEVGHLINLQDEVDGERVEIFVE